MQTLKLRSRTTCHVALIGAEKNLATYNLLFSMAKLDFPHLIENHVKPTTLTHPKEGTAISIEFEAPGPIPRDYRHSDKRAKRRLSPFLMAS